MKDWTDEQKTAINAESGTLLICAAAGSGKTSVLVERIVRKLTDPVSPVSPASLLVVTFTNAAAAEMRARIYKRLGELRAASNGAENLSGIMARLDEMSVSTMDSFCMRLVRENFSACGVEPDFSVIEEGEEKALKSQIARGITDALYEGSLGDFTDLTRLFQAGRDDTVLFDGILALSDFSMSEADPDEWLEGVAAHFQPGDVKGGVWGKILLDAMFEGVGYCVGLSEAAMAELDGEDTLREKLGDLFYAENAALNRLFQTLPAADWDGAVAALSHAKALLGARFPSVRGYTDHPVKLGVQAKRKEYKSVIDGLLSSVPASEAEHAEDVEALAPAAHQLIDAVKRFNAALFAAKQEKNAYSFSDITHFAVTLLYDPAAPDGKTALARQLSEDFSEIMIDEYQDTNRVQDRLFESLSKNGENMFLVGDIKQSIYRFRLASPELFTEKLEAYPRYDPDAPAKKSKIILSRNFRSREGVTDTVNFLFSRLMSRQCGEIEYNEDEALTFGASYYPESATPDTSVFLLESDDLGWAEAEAAFTARLIEEQVRSGLTVFENNALRPAGYGDFCILLRSAKGLAEIYAAALRGRNIPVYFDSREGFFEASEIKIALSFLRAVDDPMRDLDLLAAMLSPIGLFTPQDAAVLRSDQRAANKKKRQPLYAAVLQGAENGNAQCAGFLSLLERFRMLSATAPVGEVIETFFNETPVLSAVRAMDGGALREANLRALYETAVAFSADGDKNLCAFLRYIDVLIENGAELRKGSAGGDKNSVSILTMHRSKGLEYPFVIVGGLSKRFNLSERSNVLSVSHQLGVGLKRREPEKLKFYDTLSSKAVKLALRNAALSEELRIYYVALTRAKEKLFLLLTPSNKEKSVAEAVSLFPVNAPLPPYYLEGAATPLQWFLPALLQHPDLTPVRKDGAVTGTPSFRISVRQETVNAEQDDERETVAVPPDPETEAILRARFANTYAYAPVSGALSLHTASKLREETFSTEYFGKKVPGFLFDSSLSPADIGTATHKFLEYCSFFPAPADLNAEISRLVSLSLLSGDEGNAVKREAISGFFASELFRRVSRAERVFKEQSFTIAKSVCDFDSSVPQEFADEKTVVIGRIDLVFIENGEAVIVDYKTDRVKSLSELTSRYREQLSLYGEAVEKALGYKVKQKLLYSLTLCDFIEC